MAVAETLKQGVAIIIGSDTFLFSVTGLRCPHVHAVRNSYGGNRLPVFFRSFAEKPGCGGLRVVCTYAGVDIV